MTERKNLHICKRCLDGIECKEGPQITAKHIVEEQEDSVCDWCGCDGFEVLYELI